MRPIVIAFAFVLSAAVASAAPVQTPRDENITLQDALGRALVAAPIPAVPGTKFPVPPELTALADRMVTQTLAVLRSLWMTTLRRVSALVTAGVLLTKVLVFCSAWLGG